MTPGCLRPDQIAEVLKLPPDDPRRRHADECARCRALVLDYREFVAPADAPPGANVADARRRLEESLAREMAGTHTARPPLELRPKIAARRRAMGWQPVLATAAVLLVASAIVVTVRPRWTGTVPEDALRTDSRSDSLPARARLTTLAPTRHDDGTLELRWRGFPGADAYEVRLYGPDLAEIARLGPFADTSLAIASDGLPPGTRPGQTLGWRVAALRDRDDLAVSTAALIQLPGPTPGR